MDIEPKRAGKCWSCQYCEDVGTYRYEDYTSYMRKCNKSGHDYVDSCERYCTDYVWDGHTTEYWKESGSSSTSSSSSSSSSYSPSTSEGGGKGCLIAAIVVVVCIVVGLIITAVNEETDKKTPATKGSNSSYTDENSAEYLNKPAVVATKKSDLMLRKEPSSKASVVASMPKGAEVTILLEQGEWCYVSYKGKTGWCASKYLKVSE